MTALWITVAVLAALAGLWMTVPFLRRSQVEMAEADQTLSIYRDQASEIERDLAYGLISEAECDAARQEIESRALKAARAGGGGLTVSQRSWSIASIVMALSVIGTLVGYGWLGNPGLRDLPLVERRSEALTKRAEAGDINSRIQLLIERTKENPQNFEDWWLLARSYASVGDNASAADAYRHAAQLSDNEPGVLSAYAEAMTLANGNKVPQAAQVIFEQVRADINDPRARYYLALAKAQAQDFDGALTEWAALAAESAPEAPWMVLVRRDIVNMARFTKQDVTQYLPNASPEEIAAAGGTLLPQQSLPAADMIAKLEARLITDPKNYQGWIELAKLQVQAGDDDAAAAAIANARNEFSAAPFVLGKIDQAATELGLDLLPGSRGPTAEDIAAAQDMSPEEQADMIEGMVAGLAARLEEDPDNLDGWIMLVRSYTTLGKANQANAAAERARQQFRDNPQALNKLNGSI